MEGKKRGDEETSLDEIPDSTRERVAGAARSSRKPFVGARPGNDSSLAQGVSRSLDEIHRAGTEQNCALWCRLRNYLRAAKRTSALQCRKTSEVFRKDRPSQESSSSGSRPMMCPSSCSSIVICACGVSPL